MPKGQFFRVKLTDELKAKILASVRAGAFPKVAAMAWGVPAWQFESWMTPRAKSRTNTKQFCHEIKAAQAFARLKAEMDVYAKNPMAWLKNGPGREEPDSPGWTTVVRPQITNNDTKTINLYTSPDFVQFMGMLRTTMAPYPEALKALVDMMDGKKPQLPALPPPEPPPEPPTSVCDIEPSKN